MHSWVPTAGVSGVETEGLNNARKYTIIKFKFFKFYLSFAAYIYLFYVAIALKQISK